MSTSPPVPLTDLAFNILLALTDEDLHGYALVKELRSRSGRATLRTGTVYAALARLQDDGLVEESGRRPVRERDDQRRRYYRITPLGRSSAQAEALRLEEILSLAHEKRLLPDLT